MAVGNRGIYPARQEWGESVRQPSLFLRWRCWGGQDFIRFSSSLLRRTAAVVLTIARFVIQHPPINILPGGGGCLGSLGDRLMATKVH